MRRQQQRQRQRQRHRSRAKPGRKHIYRKAIYVYIPHAPEHKLGFFFSLARACKGILSLTHSLTHLLTHSNSHVQTKLLLFLLFLLLLLLPPPSSPSLPPSRIQLPVSTTASITLSLLLSHPIVGDHKARSGKPVGNASGRSTRRRIAQPKGKQTANKTRAGRSRRLRGEEQVQEEDQEAGTSKARKDKGGGEEKITSCSLADTHTPNTQSREMAPADRRAGAPGRENAARLGIFSFNRLEVSTRKAANPREGRRHPCRTKDALTGRGRRGAGPNSEERLYPSSRLQPSSTAAFGQALLPLQREAKAETEMQWH